MIIEVDKLPKEGLKISKDFTFYNVDLIEEEAVFLEPVHADMTIKKTGEEILIKGKIKTRLSVICSRCLAAFEFPIDSKFDLAYHPEEDDVLKEQLEGEDIEKFFYSSQKIDLKEIILEQLNLSFPFKPLCSEDCQGLCPVCGKIIKNGECSCEREAPDPRLDKLKTFIRDKG
jgi:uncharacterized protein